MTINDVRKAVAVELEALCPPGWQVSHETHQKIFSGLIHVGHVTEVRADGFCTTAFNLFVTAWVNEGTDAAAVDQLYRLLSPGPGSILSDWWTTSKLNPGQPIVDTVGETTEGPTKFLAAVIRVPMTISSD